MPKSVIHDFWCFISAENKITFNLKIFGYLSKCMDTDFNGFKVSQSILDMRLFENLSEKIMLHRIGLCEKDWGQLNWLSGGKIIAQELGCI